MAVDLAKQRARWRRNKRAARERRRMKPQPMTDHFLAAVLAERDRRAKLGEESSYVFRPQPFFRKGSWRKAVVFAADVWAATTLLEAKHGAGKATPTRIAAKLEELGLTHGYSELSLRKMVYRARTRINSLETTGHPWSPDDPFWKPFEPS